MNNARARGLLSAGLASKLILIRIHFEIFLNLLQINWKSWSLIAARSETRVDVHDINIKILLTRVEIRACQRKTTTATATAVLYSSRSIHSFIHASNFSAKRKYVSIGKSILRICARSTQSKAETFRLCLKVCRTYTYQYTRIKVNCSRVAKGGEGKHKHTDPHTDTWAVAVWPRALTVCYAYLSKTLPPPTLSTYK